MRILLETSGNIASLEQSLQAAMATPGVRSLFVLACDQNRYTPPALDALLRGISMPVFGGVFPCILHNGKAHHTGSLVLGLTQEGIPHVIHGLSDPAADYLARLERTLDGTSPGHTMLVLVDGLASRIVSFIDALFCLHGLEVNYLGGGAGSLSFLRQPCLITNAGLVADAAVVVPLETASSVAVGLGWRPIHESQTAACFSRHCPGPCKTPMKATEVRHNAILSLDWEPALEVYARLVRCHAQEALSAADVFAMARSYPLGIARLDHGHIVRDPLYLTAESHLVCAGEVPQGAFLEVLHGSQESLLQAAATACAQARSHAEEAWSAPPALCLAMDCISRSQFLGPGFDRELAVLHTPGVPMAGACSIGEIVNIGRRRLDFHNKACALAYLEQA